MIASLESDPILFLTRYNHKATRLEHTVKWQKLAVLLNSVPGDVKKTMRQWMKVWIDTKSRCKIKVMNLKTNKNSKPLSKLEHRIIRLIDLGSNKTIENPKVELNRPRYHCSSEQKNIMIANMEVDPTLILTQHSDEAARLQYMAKWQRLAVLLNSIPRGARKSWRIWLRVWIDTKSRCKKKLIDLNTNKNSTPLSEVEHRIMRLIGFQSDETIVLNPEAELESEDVETSTNDCMQLEDSLEEKPTAQQPVIQDDRQEPVNDQSLQERQIIVLEALHQTMQSILKEISSFTPILKEIAASKNRDAW